MLFRSHSELGHRARYVGVERHDNRDLMRGVRQVEADDELVVLEYEPGIFWLGGLVRAMAWLRFWRRKRVLLSVHEMAPDKYPEARQIQWHLSRPLARAPWFEALKLLVCTADVAWRFWTLRMGWLCMGWLPHRVLVHSSKGQENVRLALRLAHRANGKVRHTPLAVKQLAGSRDGLRRELGLPVDCFAFIVPGFLFRRKRIGQVIEQLPPAAELWVVGTESEYEQGYLAEIQAALARCAHGDRVRLIHDYERMEQYLLAADAAVFYYAEGYQSAAASLAVGAGKPCIFAELPAFADLVEAGLTVRTPAELHQAMVRIQDREVYEALRGRALALRERLRPGHIAAQYLATGQAASSREPGG